MAAGGHEEDELVNIMAGRVYELAGVMPVLQKHLEFTHEEVLKYLDESFYLSRGIHDGTLIDPDINEQQQELRDNFRGLMRMDADVEGYETCNWYVDKTYCIQFRFKTRLNTWYGVRVGKNLE